MRSAHQTDIVERAAGALLCLFVFTIPIEKVIFVGSLGSIARTLGMVAFAAGALAALRRRSVRFPNLALLLAGAFAVWTGCTYFWSLSPSDTVRVTFTSLQLCAMAFLIWDLCRGPRLQKLLLAAYVAGAAVAAVNTLVRYAQGLQTYYQRYAATGFEPNDFGVTVALSIPMGLYLTRTTGGAARWAARAAIVLAICGVYLSGSRTALIVTGLAFSYVALTWHAANARERISGLALFIVFIGGYFFFAPQHSRDRLSEIPEEITTGSLHNRKTIWKSGLVVWRDHPFLGIGAGAYPEAVRPELGVPALAGHRYVAHNTFISVLVECGLIGFAVYGGMLCLLGLYTLVMRPEARALWMVMLLTWAAGVSTLTWEHRKPGWLIFALIMTEWSRSFWPARKQT